MSVIDAAKRVALRQPGGVSGLAQRIGANPNTFAHKLGGQSGHNLFARELEAITLDSQDPEIAQALAFLCNHVCVPVPMVDGDADLAFDIAAVGKEFGEVMKSIVDAIADGRVTDRELATFDHRFSELLTAAMTLRAKLKSKIPTPPALKIA